MWLLDGVMAYNRIEWWSDAELSIPNRTCVEHSARRRDPGIQYPGESEGGIRLGRRRVRQRWSEVGHQQPPTTIVGPIPMQVDNSDYREVSGVKAPFH